MQYKVFLSNSDEGISTLITELLSLGWNMAGGVSAVPNIAFSIGANKDLNETVQLNLSEYKYEIAFYQAMTKE